MTTPPNRLDQILGIRYPIIVAPMFLVSNVDLTLAAIEAGCTAAIPSLNYRTSRELAEALSLIRKSTDKPFGVNLIVNRSNLRMREHLNISINEGVDYFITSLGNPEAVLKQAHENERKVFCDVTNSAHAQKVIDQGADGLIAVNAEAGGHAGQVSRLELISELKAITDKPIISAGGVGNANQFNETLAEGAAGVSVGSIFIATHEAPVSETYKQAIVNHGSDDIVMTSRLSGTPCTVINTDYVKQLGTEPSGLEKWLFRNRTLKKWLKLFRFVRSMKQMRTAAYEFTYKTVWCAGPSIQDVHAIRPVEEVVASLVKNWEGER